MVAQLPQNNTAWQSYCISFNLWSVPSCISIGQVFDKESELLTISKFWESTYMISHSCNNPTKSRIIETTTNPTLEIAKLRPKILYCHVQRLKSEHWIKKIQTLFITKAIVTEQLLYMNHCFILLAFSPHNKCMKWLLLLSSFKRCGNWGAKM